jgi:GTPase-associated protein 1, N-terminal domain type 1
MTEPFVLDQTLHGYDRGHRLLAGSVHITPEDDRAMLIMSDLSGSRVMEGFWEYITGYMLPSNAHFVLAKTWYAAEMKRPGCVWTHSLLLSPDALKAIRNAKELLPLFVRPSLNLAFRYSDRLELPQAVFHNAEFQEDLPQETETHCVLEELYGVDKGSVGLAVTSGTLMESFLLMLWSQLWPELRTNMSFCSGSLSLRVLNGRPLDLQCGPDRIRRELDTVVPSPCQHELWAKTILEDLLSPGTFRQFLRENGAGLTTRSSMAALAKVYTYSSSGNPAEALRFIVDAFPFQEQALDLKRRTLEVAANAVARLDVEETLRLLSRRAFALVSFDLANVLKSFAQLNPRTVALAFKSLAQTISAEFTSLLMDALASNFSDSDFEWMSDAIPDLFDELLLERPAIAYQPSFWNWTFSIFEKVDIFRLLLQQPGINKTSLFGGIFASGDPELLSRLVSDFSAEQLPQVLRWIQNHERAITSLEWTTYLKNHQQEFIAWLNALDHPDLQTVILAANVLDTYPPLNTILTESSINRLALAVPKLPRERHEVAAFLFVTTAWVPNPSLAAIFVDSFVSLHSALAQSKLSNRASYLISPILMPLPDADWDAWDNCEKLRRAALHFLIQNGWDFHILAHCLADNIELFYDFTRTAKAYNEGRDFMERVYNAAEKGELDFDKKRMKELRKLLKKGFW